MFVRLKRTATSFAVMVGVFWVYRLIAEPLIEPPVVEKRVVAATPEERAAAQRQRQNRLGVYARFFPEGSWERDNPIVLESDNSKLLLKEYTNKPDGRVELNPCTVIYLPEGESDGDDRRRVIIMQAPQGAVLQFDEAVDLSRGKMGRLLGGVLNGPVTIQSGPTKPEGGDDLLVTTHDVVMDDNIISTPNPVDFRFGASVGHGRDLKIVLTPSTEPTGKRRGPNIGGIQTIQLLHDVEMHLRTGAAGFLPGDQPQNYSMQVAGANPKPAAAKQNNPPVDIRCQGPFEFDPVLYVATFHDNVTALRPNRWGNGPNDSLNCEQLSVFFLPRDENKSAAKDNGKGKSKANASNAGMPRLEPKKFSAEGNPVILRAPSNSLEAQARTITYQPDAADRWLGEMESLGPGWLTIVSPRDPDARFEARWSREMKMRPQEENHVVSVLGDALVRSTRQGEIRADGIHMWLFEIPPENLPAKGTAGPGGPAGTPNDASSRIRPVRMMAEGNVKIDSPELSGSVNRLETWFNDAVAAAAGNGNLSGNPSRGDRLSMSSPNRGSGPRNPAAPRTHYEIKQGDLLQTWMAYQPRTAIEQATTRMQEAKIKGNVWFAESPSAENQEQPPDIHGDELHLEHADTNPQVTVTGRPANVVARGMTLLGQNVQLDRGANRLWIDGVGRMTIEGNRTAAGNDQRAPPRDQADDLFSGRGTLLIDWQGGLKFDGRTAHFERDVVAQQIEPDQTQTLRTPVLEATLLQPIDFNAPRMNERAGERPQVQFLFCHGPVWLERRETKDGKLTALDRLDRICDLSINRSTGELTGAVAGPEPGRMLSWNLGTPMQLSARSSTTAGKQRAANIPADAKQINFSHVQFQHDLSGNVLPDRRALTFQDQVRAIFGPVPSFESELDIDALELAPGNVSMNCDQLTVNREVNSNDRSGGELTALGNARIEGRQPEGDMFTALAPRVTYSRSKRMIVLTGEGRNFAQLDSQDQPGGAVQHLTANIIQYWPETRSAIITQPKIDSMGPAPIARTAPGGTKAVIPSAASPLPGSRAHP
jgi:hypothetical protein